MAHVAVKKLVKKYGALQVVHGVDFEIRDGEFVVLVGPSGCGKSTILRMIAGLEPITGGEIAINDRVVNDDPPRDRDIAMVFQDYALYPHMTVRQNLGFGLKMRDTPRAEIAAAVDKTADILQIRAPARPQAEAALGRPAPARRHRPRHRPRARSSSSSTSRSRTSTPSSASRCAPRSSACTWPSTRPASTSPTTRPRR